MLQTPMRVILTFHLTPKPPLNGNRLLLKVHWTKSELSMFKVMLFKMVIAACRVVWFQFYKQNGLRPLTILRRKSVTHILVWCVHGVCLHFLYGIRWAEWKRGLFYYTIMVSWKTGLIKSQSPFEDSIKSDTKHNYITNSTNSVKSSQPALPIFSPWK